MISAFDENEQDLGVCERFLKDLI